MPNLEVGCRVVWTIFPGKIAFIGPTHFGRGPWVGIILDEPKGTNNGVLKNSEGVSKAYFECEENHGIFVRKQRLTLIDETGERFEMSGNKSAHVPTCKFVFPHQYKMTHGNLNESQASIDVVADSGDFSDEFEENDTPSPSENCGNVDVEVGRYFQTIITHDVEPMENHYEAIKRTKKQKSQPITPVQQMVDILKENSALKERRFEDKSVRPDSDSSKTDFLKNLDDTDMFFLSMSKMTKQLPKIEQSRIKLGLSNSVLSAELRSNE